MPIVSVRPEPRARNGTSASFVATFQGLPVGREIEVEVWEVDSSTEASDHGGDQKLGSVRGTLLRWRGGAPASPVLTLRPSEPATTPEGAHKLGIVFPGAHEEVRLFALPGDRGEQHEGDWWEIQLRVVTPALRSSVFSVARVRRALPLGQGASYDWHGGNDLHLYADASDNEDGTSGAFADIAGAIDAARHFIFIADWSFHPYMRLSHGSAAAVSSTVGEQLVRKAHANSDMTIAIHTWDHTNMFAPDRENDWGEQILDSIAHPITHGSRPSNLLWRASSRTGEGGGPGFGWSHHQKFVVLDAEGPDGPDGRREIKAFVGGLDLTKGRFDWKQHVILPTDPHAAKFLAHFNATRPRTGFDTTLDYDDWYSGEFTAGDGKGDEHDRTAPREPWHDIYSHVVGPSAWDVVREFVGRWSLDPAYPDAQGDDGDEDMRKVQRAFLAMFDAEKFVQQHESRPGKWAVQLLRSIVHEHWGANSTWRDLAPEAIRNREFRWGAHGDVESSIQHSYLRAIEQAERFVYIETQYFIGSGSHWGRGSVANRLPETIVARAIDRIEKNLPFHAYVVIPMFPEGDPSSSGNVAQRHFQWSTIQYMSQALYGAVGDRWKDYLTFGFPARWKAHTITDSGGRLERVKRHERYMIYVHSKFMIIDDRFLIVGSANLNERSLAGGRDTEIAIAAWPSSSRQEEACVRQVRDFRHRLWHEHLGPQIPSNWADAETAACAQAVRDAGEENYRRFRCGEEQQGRGHLCVWPLHVTAHAFEFQSVGDPQFSVVIPDGPFVNSHDTEWYFYPPGAGGAVGWTDIAE